MWHTWLAFQMGLDRFREFCTPCPKKYGLPWWRVVRSDRTIGLPEPAKSEQMELLKKEGVSFTAQGKIVIEDELL
ncbi:hypothetical protein SK110_1211 [Lactococcus cremoris]|nr:hypothetical protein SK110_1211 [Lactococcus cremoris]